jgi:hypothetical protein
LLFILNFNLKTVTLLAAKMKAFYFTVSNTNKYVKSMKKKVCCLEKGWAAVVSDFRSKNIGKKGNFIK